MNTPIYDFVKEYKNNNMSRFHMPGHKGQAFLGCEDIDITEISGADVLSMAEGIIRESQENAAKLFDSGASFYSTEGSSQCIKAMLETVRHAYVCRNKSSSERKYVLAARNVHRAMIDACALLDIDIEFVMPNASVSICSGMITPEMLMAKLKTCAKGLIGVYITSPDYLGNIADVKGISEVCDKYDIPLIVDNAHGAYLAFLDEKQHPIQLGAAICCDSAHKTLPVLTGGAYIHVSKQYKNRFQDYISKALTLFGSTSPSYLILQSLDLCNKYIAKDYKQKLKAVIDKTNKVKNELKAMSINIMTSEKLKIVIDASAAGYTGEEIADELRKYKIECEYADRQYVVLMISGENTDKDFERIMEWGKNSILTRKPKEAIKYEPVYSNNISRAMTIREAVFAPCEMIAVSEAEGKVCAAEVISCPPAIPIAVSGEIIDKNMIKLFNAYNIDNVCVVN